MAYNNWENEIDNIKELLKTESLEDIGKVYGVSKQRVYQILTKYGVDTPIKQRNNWLKDKPKELYWLNRTLCDKHVLREERNSLLKELTPLPTHCPVLGLKLDYEAKYTGWKGRIEESPSLDRIDNSKGYVSGNIAIISWRANRIKNDGNSSEHRRIANWIDEMT